MVPIEFRCYRIDRVRDQVEGQIAHLPLTDLKGGSVLVRVYWSSLNYKDALAANGHPGVVQSFPHVPGIDAAGIIAESNDPDFASGEEVIVTGYELGAGHWGGWSEYIRVPSEWVVPKPEGLTLREAMSLGTAGFTAAQCVRALQQNQIQPDTGPVVVSGSTGGVGCLAVAMLARLGYEVFAATGKAEEKTWLAELGATQVLERDELIDASGKPLLRSKWVGAIDTVGGDTLSTLLRSTHNHGCVAACGMVGGSDLPLTVYPFILRGATLAGVTSAWCPTPTRQEIWHQLATDWKLACLDHVCTSIQLTDLPEYVERIYRGQLRGRTVVSITKE